MTRHQENVTATTLAGIIVGCLLIAAAPPPKALLTVYKDNFREPYSVGNRIEARWTDGDKNRGKSPTEVPFKGIYSTKSGAQTTLELKHLPKHEAVVVSFNLITVGPWKEKGTDFDLGFRIANDQPRVRLLLANPKTNPAPLGTGRKGLVGFQDAPDNLYSLCIAFPHSTSASTGLYQGRISSRRYRLWHPRDGGFSV
jgi:hypothetical protein